MPSRHRIVRPRDVRHQPERPPTDPLLVHDAGQEDPSYAFALSRLDSAGFAHAPIGIFRKAERPSYDALMAQQIREEQTKQGDGNLATLLAGGDTWEIR